MSFSSGAKQIRSELNSLKQSFPKTGAERELWQLYASDPVLWAKDVLGFHPDPWQADLLRSRAKNIILNCSRQSGKSTICAALGLHESIYRSPSFGLIVSPSQDQSAETMLKFDEFRSAVELPSDYLDSDTKLAVKFRNGNRFIARPGSERTSRSFSAVSLLLEDEASRVLDELYNSVRPMLSVSNGRHILMSTPNGKRGHFWTTWNEQRDMWEAYEIPAELCPRISKEFLEQEKQINPWFEQEYHCKFEESEFQFISDELIDRAFVDIPCLFPKSSKPPEEIPGIEDEGDGVVVNEPSLRQLMEQDRLAEEANKKAET